MYCPGDIASTTLHGLPGLGRWTLDASALVLAAEPGDLLLYVYQAAIGAEFFARGPADTALHGGGMQLHDPVTTGLQPARIRLGEITNPGDPSSAVNELLQRAHAELAPQWTARGDGPLTTDALPVLDQACTRLAASRAAADAAEDARDLLVQRFAAGGLGPTALARPGLSASRVSQLTKHVRTGVA
ncbi:hypothetical protein C7C46_08865 [Streptomyces tateyamensis]|uniref:Uncharacterized protein n=1 Tax=Streptomyces tateyamensis TaxID=565073 RepID=A0A2V4NT47_9ACTN|nr:hypothetical protein [Streptomyces tateyamensis]PYC83436.1 hypothetical protein C7C46_08865 [Streptomyces tateyamensis]